jgi:hypothetical protein
LALKRQTDKCGLGFWGIRNKDHDEIGAAGWVDWEQDVKLGIE